MLLMFEVAAALRTAVDDDEIVTMMQDRNPDLGEAECRSMIESMRAEFAARAPRRSSRARPQRELPAAAAI